MPASRRLEELSAPGAVAALDERSVLVLPVGAVEQHGPHLPLSTDLTVASALVDLVVERHGDALDLWSLPPLAYTKSDEHAWAPGTVWLSATTLLAVLDDIGRSLAALPTKRLAFVNGHGGNTQLLAVANRELRTKHRLLTFLLHPHVPRDSGGAGAPDDAELGMGVHAGRDETAVMLHLRPDLVDMSLAERSVPESMARRDRVRFGGDVPFGWSSDDLASNGVVGDPTLADPALGARLVEGMVASLSGALAEIRDFDFPR